MAVRSCFIRGSTVRYVQLPRAAVDTQLLEDATRRGAFSAVLPRMPFVIPVPSAARNRRLTIGSRVTHRGRQAAIESLASSYRRSGAAAVVPYPQEVQRRGASVFPPPAVKIRAPPSHDGASCLTKFVLHARCVSATPAVSCPLASFSAALVPAPLRDFRLSALPSLRSIRARQQPWRPPKPHNSSLSTS